MIAAGGTLLAGSALTVLRRHRRSQMRRRPPGRFIGATPDDVLDTERVLLAAGGDGMGPHPVDGPGAAVAGDHPRARRPARRAGRCGSPTTAWNWCSAAPGPRRPPRGPQQPTACAGSWTAPTS